MTSSHEKSTGGRRSSHVGMPAAYASVGATRDPDLLRFPPAGSTPYQEELRLGSGDERFIAASSLLMTWGAQRGAGMTVEVIERGPDDEYTGVAFDENGAAQAATPREDTFGPDGEPYLNAGTSARVTAPGQPARQVLIVYTVDEERRVGFAWGTGDEEGAVGEQQFVVERRDDDTVWAVARGFLTPPKSGLLGLKARADLRSALEEVKQQIQALSPVVASANLAAAADSVGDGPATIDTEPVAAEAESIASEAEPTAGDAEPVAGDADAAELQAEAEASAGSATEVPSEPDAPTRPTNHQRRPSRSSGEQGE